MNFKNLNDMQKKLVKYIIFGVVGLVLLFVILFIIKLIIGNKLPFDKIEAKMVKAADSYYKANPDLLPESEVSATELNVTTLAEAGYMKPLEKYLDEEVSCTGKVMILKNGSYYTFVPKLNCGGDYTTNSLVKKITSKSNIVESGDGLYEENGEYIYRGEKLNNYVSFAGKNWRIIKITKDNEIRLIQDDFFEQQDWDNRYNDSQRSNSGINDYNVSRIKDDLAEIYNGTTFSATDKAKIVPKNLCIGKRAENDTTKDGSTECSVLTDELLPLGLLQANEYLVSSLDSGCTDLTKKQCTNYNFLANYERHYWTLTGNSANTAHVYYIDRLPQSLNASSYAVIKLVINVSGEVNYIKGNGTLENPYIID